MPESLKLVGFIVVWAASLGVLLYAGFHSLMALNSYPITGFRNLVWPPIRNIAPVELPVKYILHRNKARRAMTLLFGASAMFFAILVASAFLGGL